MPLHLDCETKMAFPLIFFITYVSPVFGELVPRDAVRVILSGDRTGATTGNWGSYEQKLF